MTRPKLTPDVVEYLAASLVRRHGSSAALGLIAKWRAGSTAGYTE
jgi:hypothetical protein